MVKINRLFLGMDVKYDARIENVLSLINSNLDNDLSIDMLSKAFYLNKYCLMHLFKAETGYTLYLSTIIGLVIFKPYYILIIL